jgi:hypothetical protein
MPRTFFADYFRRTICGGKANATDNKRPFIYVNKALQNSTAAPHDAVIRVYDNAGNVIETHEHTDDFKEC